MTKRIAAIVFIFACTTVAWFILGSTISIRTFSSDASLRGKVESIWGAPHEQAPPLAYWEKTVPKVVESVEDGKRIRRVAEEKVITALPLESSRIDVVLHLEHRQKGLLWYSTYKVAFSGAYAFRNTGNQEQVVTFRLDFPTAQGTYDDLTFLLNGAALPISSSKSAVTATGRVAAGSTAQLQVGYRSQGLDHWRYKFGGEITQVRDFTLRMSTNFKDIDFPENTLSPSEKQGTPQGWELLWKYKSLLSGFEIGMTMPQKLQPGPLAGEISYFAPVSLFFFFFLMFIVATLRDIELHPMNYFFLAGAFFSFHLLLAYLVDHISIHTAFVVCSVVSVLLVVSYLRLVVNIRFAAIDGALAQLIYLILFSYAFFFKGFTGLTVTIGSILTLFVVMQITGRIRWSEKFAAKPAR